MKTRKARIVLRNGPVIEDAGITDADWVEFLRLNDRWRSGRTGGVDFNYSTGGGTATLQFEYSDIERIDLWPGSEEAW